MLGVRKGRKIAEEERLANNPKHEKKIKRARRCKGKARKSERGKYKKMLLFPLSSKRLHKSGCI